MMRCKFADGCGDLRIGTVMRTKLGDATLTAWPSPSVERVCNSNYIVKLFIVRCRLLNIFYFVKLKNFLLTIMITYTIHAYSKTESIVHIIFLCS